MLKRAGVIQLTPQMRFLVVVEPQDFRRGVDGMARICKDALASDPFSGTAYVFRNRRGTAIKILVYDGQRFWLCHKRLSSGKFAHVDPIGRERPAAGSRKLSSTRRGTDSIRVPRVRPSPGSPDELDAPLCSFTIPAA